LPVKHGEEILLADAPESFADAVVALLADPEKARAIGSSAAQSVRDQFGWPRVAEKFAEICQSAM